LTDGWYGSNRSQEEDREYFHELAVLQDDESYIGKTVGLTAMRMMTALGRKYSPFRAVSRDCTPDGKYPKPILPLPNQIYS
jgi:hypothetical protein